MRETARLLEAVVLAGDLVSAPERIKAVAAEFESVRRAIGVLD